jgi:hypothetical protein
MGIHPVSFLVGVGTAAALPLLTRTFRPVAVQLAVAGMGLFEELRRAMAEQMEVLEDIAAEARAKREETLGADAMEPSNGSEPAAGGERPARRLRKQRTAQARPGVMGSTDLVS